MIVLVSGGRDYNNRQLVFKTLNDIHHEFGIDCVIHGGASGADTLANVWANLNNICCIKCMADWKKHGKAAGPIRNQLMLDKHLPDLVVTFPGGRGTANMIKLAKKANVDVQLVTDNSN